MRFLKVACTTLMPIELCVREIKIHSNALFAYFLQIATQFYVTVQLKRAKCFPCFVIQIAFLYKNLKYLHNYLKFRIVVNLATILTIVNLSIVIASVIREFYNILLIRVDCNICYNNASYRDKKITLFIVPHH